MEENKIKISDLGIIITIGGVMLYSLGWIFWVSFYMGLNIDESFVDIPIERVLADSWFPIAFFLPLIAGFLFFSPSIKELPVRKVPSIIFIFCVVFMFLLPILPTQNINIYLVIGFIIIASISFVLLKKYSEKVKVFENNKIYIISACFIPIRGSTYDREDSLF